LKSGELFEDTDFPCIQSSVFYHESPPFNFVWKRPFELTSDPKFLSLSNPSSPASFDSILGRLGDPWFISSISLLHQTKGLFYRVVPADQSFDSEEYAGIFRFRIWWFGQWQEVIIDDRLPTVNNKLVFITQLNGNIYWTCLLEKAMAKLHGSYEALKYGTTLEALADLTGGVSEMNDLKSEDPLASRLFIQRLLNITCIVTAVVSSEDCQSSHLFSSNEGNRNGNRHVNSESPPQFLYPFSNGIKNHCQYRNGNGMQINSKTSASTSSSSSSSAAVEAPLHSSFPSSSYHHHHRNHGSSGFPSEEESLGQSSSSSSCSSSSNSTPFPRSNTGIRGCVNYRITAIERVEVVQDDGNRDQVFLLRLTNPLGKANTSHSLEYLGSYGSKLCPHWKYVSESDRLRLFSLDEEDEAGEEYKYDGEDFLPETNTNGVILPKPIKQNRRKRRSCNNSFWMEFNDFISTFSHLEVVYLDGETSRDEPSLRENKLPMTVKLYRGVWRRGVTAGGCRNNGDTFHLNPQLEVTLTMESDDMIVCCLNQHSVLEPQVVGFSIYSSPQTIGNGMIISNGTPMKKVLPSPPNNDRLDRAFFKKHKSLINSSYSNSRQVVLRCSLDRGSFILLPTSFEPGFEGMFSFRVYSMKGVKLRVLDGDNSVIKSPIMKSPASFDAKFAQYEHLFNQVSDEHKSVNCHDLQELLEASLPNDYVKSCATIDVCRLIISALDTTGFGRLHFRDYKNIMCSLRFWQNSFKNHTKGTTGILRVEKLEEALCEVGFKLSTDVLSLIILKFMRKDSTLRFGDFVSVILHLCISFNLFDKHNKSSSTQQPQTNNASAHHLSKISIHHQHQHHHQPSSCISLNEWLKISLQT